MRTKSHYTSVPDGMGVKRLHIKGREAEVRAACEKHGVRIHDIGEYPLILTKGEYQCIVVSDVNVQKLADWMREAPQIPPFPSGTLLLWGFAE